MPTMHTRAVLLCLLAASAHASAPMRVPPTVSPSVAAPHRPLAPVGDIFGRMLFPNISHTSSELHLAAGLAFTAPTLFLRGASRAGVSACRMASQTLEREHPIIDGLKRGWIGFERIMVTITQGSQMAEAAVTLEEDRLFGSRRLARAKKAVDSMISNRMQQKTANLEDCYSAQAFGFEASQHIDQPHKVRPRKERAPAVSTMAHYMPTADMSDCYSKGVFSGAGDEIELSAGYREGDDDDLPLLKDLKKVQPSGKDARYAGNTLHDAYPDSAFRD